MSIEILQQPIDDRSAWKRADLEADSDQWRSALDGEDQAELIAATEAFLLTGRSLHTIRREDFVLPRLGGKLARLSAELENGLGVHVLTGVPTLQLGLEGARCALFGMGSHMGSFVSQNARGELIASVMDRSVPGSPRAYQSNRRISFHADNADVAALLFLTTAKRGGSSLVVSTMSIFNEILKERPEYLERLFRGYVYSLLGENRPEVEPHSGHRIPIFSYLAGKLSSRFVRLSIEAGARLAEQPLDEKDFEILDYFESLCRREDLFFQFDMAPGDLMFVNNHTILHDRTEFEDWEDPERKRHALRLWINLHDGRPLTYEFSNRAGPGSGRLGIPPVAQPPAHIVPS